MKCHANKDYPNFPHPGVHSSRIMTFTSLIRILHSKFQGSDYASDGKCLLSLSFLLPPVWRDSSALQKQLALPPHKGIKTKCCMKEKKTHPLTCARQNYSRTLRLVLRHWQYLQSWSLNWKSSFPSPAEPEERKSLATPSLAHSFPLSRTDSSSSQQDNPTKLLRVAPKGHRIPPCL